MSGSPSFESFDWDDDPRWKAYQQRIEVTNPAVLNWARAKFYQKEIDPTFDPNSVPDGRPGTSNPSAHAGANRQTPGPSTHATHSDQASAQQRQTAAGPSVAQADAGSPQSRSSGPQGGAGGIGKWRQMLQQAGSKDVVQFAANVLLMALFVLYMQPLHRHLSRIAYRLFMLLGFISHTSKVVQRFGVPPLQPFPAAPKSWLQRAAATTDLQYAVICLLFSSQRPLTLIMMPILVLAVYHGASFASAHFSHIPLWQQYGAPAHRWLIARQRDAQVRNAWMEVTVGFMLIAMLLTANRNLLLTFLYWNILRARRITPDCAAYHSMVWGMIDQRMSPLLARFPALQTPVSYARRWFTNAG